METERLRPVDVVIVGAGPSGTSAALTLHNMGLSCVIVDKAEFPRDKCCGDGLTTSSLRQLEALGFDPTVLPSWRIVESTAWRSPSGYTSVLPLPPDEDGIRIAVAKREELDNALVDLVRAKDIPLYENHPLHTIDLSGRGITITAGERTFSARYLIAADGVWSPTRKLVSATRKLVPASSEEGPYLGDIHAFRQYYKNVTGPAKDRLFVSFEPDLLPGYFWSFPMSDGLVNVGFGIERTEGRSVSMMKKLWPDIMQRPHIRDELGLAAEPEAPHKAWPIPAKIDSNLLTAGDGRVLFVGDAARVVDPLTGEGIGQALETGRVAAEAIATHGRTSPAEAAASYKRYIKLGMKIDNSVAGAIAKLVRSDYVTRAVIRMTPHLNRRDYYAVRWVFEDNPRAAALTPWRWKERFGEEKTAAYKSLRSKSA